MKYRGWEAAVPKLALAGALGVFFLLMFPLLKPYPFSDDWSYLEALSGGGSLSLKWLFGLHNDHRIPIQKLLHYFLLMPTGGDFRALMLLNMAFAAIAAWCWIRIARLLRDGRPSLGDACAPLILLGGGFNGVSWGFSFQFISSVAFASLAAWAAVSYLRGRLSYGVEYAFLLLILCAWCGGNGIISAAALGAPLLLLCAAEHRAATRLRTRVRFLAVGLWAATLAGLVLTWKPSGATAQSEHGLAQQLPPFLAGMLKSWMGVYAMADDGPKLALTAAIVAAAVLVGVWTLWRRWRLRERRGFETLIVLAVLGQSLLTLMVVAVSRAVAQPWSPGLELHYGFLTTLIPLSAWALISAGAGPRTQRALALLALAGAAWIFSYNTDWRIGSLRDGYPQVAAAQAALLSKRSAAEVADKHIQEYYYLHDPASREAVAEAIPLLRQMPLWRERPGTPQE
ncbi:hypothetical protein K4L06_02320 [Lysobacter sp. BMK333-48F3]|uniref:hypothetical protein n=1 Tax=Lysobacter sp. BMK333-48F3 TaxID=2867962 RepID=UPI001C8C4AD6|nr:hypothetical protein [Lysobacter sp. BMK333-48F3]MBX9400130.1 hypothetical protein [Lysobacter sp. BMK333-48F3]